MMTFEINPRRALAVYFRSRRAVRSIRHYGRLIYISRRMHYAILYVDQARVDETTNKLLELRQVTAVKPSPRPEIDPQLTDLRSTMAFHQDEEDDFS